MGGRGHARVKLTVPCDDAEAREHLHSIASPLHNALLSVSTALNSEKGVTMDTIEGTTNSLSEMLWYLSTLSAQNEPTIREGHGVLPPVRGDPDVMTLYEPTSENVLDFEWLLQQIISINDGTFSVRITKDTGGFRVLLNHSSTVVRYDSDATFEIPAYATDVSPDDGDQYLERAIWSQSRATKKFERLLTDLESEIPPANPAEEPACDGTLAPLYRDGGFTFRVSRVGPAFSFAVDREQADVNPVRTLSSPSA